MEYTTNAPNGAALLDEIRPGWAGEINLETFDMANTQLCVLGQLFGSYGYWPDLFLDDANRSPSDEQHPCYVHGFDRHLVTGPDYSVLRAEWTTLIRERKQA